MAYRLFTKQGCGACEMARKLLRSKGIAFTEVSVDTQQGLEEAQKLGIDSTGVVVDERGNKVPLSNIPCQKCRNRG